MSHHLLRSIALALALILAACGGDGPTGDNEGPTVVSFTPSANATGIPRVTTISATFSEPIDPSSITEFSFTVTMPMGTPVPGTVSVDGAVMTFTPTFPLPNGMVLSVRVSREVEDMAGNTMGTAVTWTFTTVVNPLPTVVSVSPAQGAVNVDPRTTIIATFSEPVTAPLIDSFYLTSNHAITGTIVASGSTLTLTPSAPLVAGTTYIGHLQTSIVDADGGTLQQNYTWTFTTAATPSP